MPDIASFLTFGGAVLTAIIATFGTIYVARGKTRSDLGAIVTTGFRELTNQLQEERNQLNQIIWRQRAELAEAEKRLNEIEEKQRKLRRHLIELEQMLARAGLPVPQHDLY